MSWILLTLWLSYTKSEGSSFYSDRPGYVLVSFYLGENARLKLP